jgi:hypothetical protein
MFFICCSPEEEVEIPISGVYLVLKCLQCLTLNEVIFSQNNVARLFCYCNTCKTFRIQDRIGNKKN